MAVKNPNQNDDKNTDTVNFDAKRNANDKINFVRLEKDFFLFILYL